jgi:enoyl-CoA hydratase/carnithine racemase
MQSPLDLALDGMIATITLNRPEKHNLLTVDDLASLGALLDRAAASDARVLVVTGAGARSFSAGIDLGDVLATDWSRNPLEALIDKVEASPLPTIAAMNGFAYGGAADLALACDFRIGVDGMRVAMPPAKLGVMLHVSGLRRFATRTGANAARRLLVAGETLDAAALHRAGYLDRVVAPDALAAEARAMAQGIAALAPRAVQGMKRALAAIERGDLDLPAVKAEILALFSSEDLKEGLAAFAEKRPPRFTGR